MSFVLRFPFRPQCAIAGIDDSAYFAIGTLNARLRNRSPYAVLEIHNFETAQAAYDFISVVWAALRWVLITGNLNTTCEFLPREPAWAEEPDRAAHNLSASFGLPITGPIHGICEEGWPTVYEEGKSLRFIGLGDVAVAVTTPVDLFLSNLKYGLERPRSSSLINDPRFRLASDLFSAFHFEPSPPTRLISLGMSLEVLAEPETKHLEALSLLEKWQVELAGRKTEVEGNDDAVHALESLERELMFRKEASIRSRIRRTAMKLGNYFGLDQAVLLAQDAIATYDDRSALIHNGTLDEPRLSQTVEKGRDTVCRLLQAYYQLALGNDQ